MDKNKVIAKKSFPPGFEILITYLPARSTRLILLEISEGRLFSRIA